MNSPIAARFDVLLVGGGSLMRGITPRFEVRCVDLVEDMGLTGFMLEGAEDDDDLLRQLLELIWKYGQNDFQERECRSLMVGDVIVLPFAPFYVEIRSNGFWAANLVAN